MMRWWTVRRRRRETLDRLLVAWLLDVVGDPAPEMPEVQALLDGQAVGR